MRYYVLHIYILLTTHICIIKLTFRMIDEYSLIDTDEYSSVLIDNDEYSYSSIDTDEYMETC